MDRETFARRFREAADAAREVARPLVEEELPGPLRFRLRLGRSFDGIPLQPGEAVYPDDSSIDRARALRDCSEEAVVSNLWRDGAAPQWVSVQVVSVTAATTILEVVACSRFTRDETLFDHQHEGRPPFHVLGPEVPFDGIEGQRFSIHHHPVCATAAEIDPLRARPAVVRWLALEGEAFDDRALQALPALPNLVVLELRDSPIRGPGLESLARHAMLWSVRIDLGRPDGFSIPKLPRLSNITTFALNNAPVRPWGFEQLARQITHLGSLTVDGPGELHLGPCPQRLGDLGLAGSKVVGEVRLPEIVDRLSLALAAASDDELERLLAPVTKIRRLALGSMAVGDALVERLVARLPSLEELEVAGASRLVARDLAAARPKRRLS